jgi:hypothetical protein
MKKLSFACTLLSLCLLTACGGSDGKTADATDARKSEEKEDKGSGFSFSKGSKKDMSTGLESSYNGFSIDEGIYFVGPDNEPKSDNKVQLGTKVAIVFKGIKGYEVKDGKVFPGMMITVIDKEGNKVMDYPDLFAEAKEGYSETDGSILRGDLTIGTPIVSGKTYEFKVKVWDKNKADNEITSKVDIEVQ